jgi:Transglutaminase-like superfamily
VDNAQSLEPINASLNLGERFIGLLAVALAYLAARWLSLEKISNLLRIFKSHVFRQITMSEAEIAWASVRKSSFYFPGRTACLELSLAFVLFALMRRRSSTWCVGVATDPIRSHAWVEVDRKPFREQDGFERHFRRMLIV